VPLAEYDSLYKEFNPVLFNADVWVKAAKDAGMRYLTIVAKHHDGFCLWPTAYSSYNIAHTPFKRDIVGELAAACKRQGLAFCIYFTVLDWHDPDYPQHRMAPNTTGSMPVFIARMKNELKELIDHYHPEMLWFDGNWEESWKQEYGVAVYRYIKSIAPHVVINNRLGKPDSQVSLPNGAGDYVTPEQTIGKLNMDIPWESCITICKQWAWKPNDTLKSLTECITTLVRSAAGNGNLLFNVGPMMDGRMEARQVTRLKEIGRWLKKNGSSIYDTKGGPYVPNAKFASTRKGNKVFIHVFGKENVLVLPVLAGVEIKKAYSMNGQAVTVDRSGVSIRLELPAGLTDELCPVIVLELDKNAEAIPITE
jgi:alpha-L-fucosidase